MDLEVELANAEQKFHDIKQQILSVLENICSNVEDFQNKFLELSKDLAQLKNTEIKNSLKTINLDKQATLFDNLNELSPIDDNKDLKIKLQNLRNEGFEILQELKFIISSIQNNEISTK